MRNFRIFGVPMDLGQRRRGVDMGPSALRYAGLDDQLRALGHSVTDNGNLPVPLPENEPPDDSRARHLRSVAAVCRDVHANALACLEHNETAIFLGGEALVVGLLAMALATRSIADPIVSVRRALDRVRGGDIGGHVNVYDGSEVGLLQAGFNEMVAGLREREHLQDIFGRHVGEDVARQAVEHGVVLGGEVRDVAVLFVDIVGSTELASKLPPTEVVRQLNEFFDVVVSTVRNHEGSINKFVGDAVLCVFGAPVGLSEARSAALAAARELHTRLASEVPGLAAGIGVSAGGAVAGNVGTAERFEYTVIGDPVNEAARLTELAKQRGGVLASGDAVDGAVQEEAGHWELGESIVLRGRERPTRVARPLAG